MVNSVEYPPIFQNLPEINYRRFDFYLKISTLWCVS